MTDYRIPARRLAVAAAIYDLARGATEIVVRDEDMATITGYAVRSVQLAMTELADLGAITYERSKDGVRLINVNSRHAMFAIAVGMEAWA